MAENETQDLLTVKQFAEAAGVTQQAVYQRLNKSLTSFVVEVNGQKYLKREALANFERPEQKPNSRPLEQDFNKVEQGFNKVEQGLIDTLQQTITVLQAQLETKDKQISELNARLDQALQITSQSHFIAAQAQAQLTEATTPPAGESPAEAPQEAQEPQKKGFFSWLFRN